ncbi:hypothetical protein [Myxosarcina sp. GI1]|uniref:hypothetical protein n=1 Tax=Myxosarcina sp. GI1 TaxID=1541065 RepID=UPI00056D1845|nr:hypothetical protein [Myxosarcina sp. GI1]
MKIPDCDRCLLYAHNPYFVCAVHPDGVTSDKPDGMASLRCMDFRPNPNAEKAEQWSPEGYSWYNDELIPNRPSSYTQAEQLEILDTHPVFTGVCPQCRYRFNERLVHYDCPECGWMDDSV